MKRLYAFVLVVLLAALTAARGASLDDQYVQIFNKIQDGDRLSAIQPGLATTRYLEAQSALRQMQKETPDWNPKVVTFRLNYLATRIQALSSPSPAPVPALPTLPVVTNPTPAASPAAPPVTPTPEQPTPSPSPAPSPPPAVPNELLIQLNLLKDQIRRLEVDKSLLESKLKEADSLAVRPAAVDPRELARAQDKIRSLQKENDLLTTTLDQQKAKPAPVIDTKGYEAAKQALAEANRVLATQKELNQKLTLERDALRTQLQSPGPDAPTAAALRAENALLKKQLADLKTAPAATTPAGDAARKLAEAQTQIALLQSDKEVLRLEKIALESRVRQLATANPQALLPPPMPAAAKAPATPASSPAADSSRIKRLENERDSLQKQLDAARKELANQRSKSGDARLAALQIELDTARARLDAFEARAVPYSAEELALLNRSQPVLTPDPNAGKKSIQELPPGSAKLVAEAQTYYAARQFDKAEAAYQEILRQDKKNVPALANLAAIQIQDGHLDSAQTNITQALVLAPDDAYSLYVMGLLRLQQSKYDDAVDALSRAAKLDPQNAEVQNYLGLALSGKGLRGPAEAALRKAIELRPDYAAAHYNLAVIYLTHQPPAPALARWEYDRAVTAGFPRNPDFEKRLQAANPPP
jgi:tetratricopeptide (TPR) repeat protein